MNVDSNMFENWFTTTTPQGQQVSLWDNILNAGGQVINSLPDVVDGIIDTKLDAERKTQTEKTENIASTNPNVAGEANSKNPMNNQNMMMGMYVVGGLLATVVLIKVLK
ncbi:TMhelix containing protein [Vibrio phage 1.020.O._10N.222.48.A2]|uniref:TMhelix containing protein n=1 Tax=Vibrio phage 1.020.O._10N.222.48.A2 TaxID=1881450 RepID=A0A2I7QKZ5_9VIRU|nr:TMhelix containing protein [Vibrio phage 1.020.O._10N.222.48.A2]AUR82055.1 TMhelix containing protein [Vibrio phage 1.020.O._10N.222.48.A2]